MRSIKSADPPKDWSLKSNKKNNDTSSFMFLQIGHFVTLQILCTTLFCILAWQIYFTCCNWQYMYRSRKWCTHSSISIHSYDHKCFDILLEKAILALVWGTGCRWAMNPHDLTDDCSSVGSHSCTDDLNCRVLSTHCRLYLVFQRMGSSRTFQSRSCRQTMKRQALRCLDGRYKRRVNYQRWQLFVNLGLIYLGL